MPKHKGTQKKGNNWYWYIDYRGRRYWSKGFDSAEEAAQKRILAKKHLIESTYIEPNKITVKEFIIQYLNEYALTHMRELSIAVVEGNFRNHVIPAIGEIKLQDLQPYHILKLQNKIRKKISDKKAR